VKQWTKIILVVAITAAVSFGLGASLARTGTIKALVGAVADNEAINEVGRVESWDRVEQLLAKGCTKEALELVRIEQSLALSAIKRQVGDDRDRMAKLRARNPDVAKRTESVSSGKTYTIPTCK
jgi:hypothetical protein